MSPRGNLQSMDRPLRPPYQRVSLGNAGTIYIRPAAVFLVHYLDGRPRSMELRQLIGRTQVYGFEVCIDCV